MDSMVVVVEGICTRRIGCRLVAGNVRRSYYPNLLSVFWHMWVPAFHEGGNLVVVVVVVDCLWLMGGMVPYLRGTSSNDVGFWFFGGRLPFVWQRQAYARGTVGRWDAARRMEQRERIRRGENHHVLTLTLFHLGRGECHEYTDCTLTSILCESHPDFPGVQAFVPSLRLLLPISVPFARIPSAAPDSHYHSSLAPTSAERISNISSLPLSTSHHNPTPPTAHRSSPLRSTDAHSSLSLVSSPHNSSRVNMSAPQTPEGKSSCLLPNST